MKAFLFIFVLLLSLCSKAQPPQEGLEFRLTVEGQEMVLNKSYFISAIQDSITFKALKFYISDLQFFQSGKKLAQPLQQHFLIDIEDPPSLQPDISPCHDQAFDSLTFQIGIDSLTNVSGAYGGDLDPTNGMYWTWQSGYINLKLEGASSLCPGKNHVFQFHLGGYQPPYNCLQKVELQLSETKSVLIEVAIDRLLAQLDLTEQYKIMSPGSSAVEMSRQFSAIFSIAK